MEHFLLDDPWKAMAPFESPFHFEFVPLLVGAAFLAPVEVSFSTWFFLFAHSRPIVGGPLSRTT